LRWVIIGGWIAAVVFAVLYLPPLSSSGGLSDLIPPGSSAAHAEADAARLFGFPLDPAVAVVQGDPHGLPASVVQRSVRQAVAVDRGQGAVRVPGLAFAVPLPNTAGLLPGTREQSTTIVTFLSFRPGVSFAAQTTGAALYARGYLGFSGSHVVGVTGVIPARTAQGLLIVRYLGWVELFTVLAIAVIVGVRFRSVGAPLVALLCAGTAYELSVRIVAWAAQQSGISLPPDLEPVLVVLLLGVTTDYSVFFLAGMQARLAAGEPRSRAVRLAIAEYAPIIFTAGLVVAAGTGSLYVARSAVLRAFGPGLAVTVLTAMAVSMTLCPALMAVLGRWLFRASGGSFNWDSVDLRGKVARVAATRPVALLIVAACCAGLIAAGLGARQMRVGSPLIRELPASSSVVRAAAAAAAGFAPGILSPTEILVVGPGVVTPIFKQGVTPISKQGVPGQGAALSRLEDLLRRQPGVVSVVGPPNLPVALAPFNPLLAKSGDAVRFAVVFGSDPLDAAAISNLRALQGRLAALGRAAGLSTSVRFEVGGETALTASAISATVDDLWRIALAIMVVTLVLLALFLRAVLAPVYLLAASVLAVLASLGVTVLICRALFGSANLVYYVPFAAGVLLVALGSDYNVFVVGRIWEETRRRPVPDAVAVAGPRASRAITTAGVALAASFALLAVIPLLQFRQIAITMAAGVIIDALVVRSLLVPALVALFGRVGMWPGGRRVSGGTAVTSESSLPVRDTAGHG
jgi:RND superfamily putative drug exporter